ncbi:MAG: SDR family oxidoreductase [Phycisphaerales bacterium]|nr:SDR family oxidoreductase [Planctomycetota bacterium]MCH8507597.1 SDR family oxidoreductase [Phycisphaerales bacterium]
MTTTILITGANRGIGLALARHAAQRGHTVIGTARDPGKADELRAVSGPAGGVRIERLDADSDESCKALAKALAGTPIDILINNAGVSPDGSKDLATFDPGAYLACLRTNSVGPLLVTRALLPNVEASRRKLVVQISSIMGSLTNAVDQGWTGNLAYHSSKSALNMANTLIANQLKDKGVACVGVHPGWVQTDMGGPNAHLTPDASASSILDTVDSLGIEDAGKFLNYDGKPLPW